MKIESHVSSCAHPFAPGRGLLSVVYLKSINSLLYNRGVGCYQHPASLIAQGATVTPLPPESYLKNPEPSTISVDLKVCSRCHLPLPIDDFYLVKSGSSRRLGHCKSCSKIASTEYEKNNRENRNESKRLWKINNPELTKAIRRKNYLKKQEERQRYTREWRENNPDKARVSSQNHNLKRKGVDAEWYAKTLTDQKGGCALCGSTDPRTPTGRFSIDHDHSCCPRNHACDKCRRGLLCTPCNARLGHLENVAWKRQAMTYLNKWRKDGKQYDEAQGSLFD